MPKLQIGLHIRGDYILIHVSDKLASCAVFSVLK